MLGYLCRGWPQKVSGELAPFWRRKEELSIEGNCILWGIRVVVPKSLQPRVMAELHVADPDIVRIKQLARSRPELNKEIERYVQACGACQTRNVPAKAPLHPWAWSTKFWERVHINFAGPV